MNKRTYCRLTEAQTTIQKQKTRLWCPLYLAGKFYSIWKSDINERLRRFGSYNIGHLYIHSKCCGNCIFKMTTHKQTHAGLNASNILAEAKAIFYYRKQTGFIILVFSCINNNNFVIE